MKTLETIAGILEFNYGWAKKINLEIDSNLFELPLVFEAFEGESVTEQQLQNYELFIEKKHSYEQKISSLIHQYILNETIQNPKYTPNTLLFKRDGSFGLLCDCNWDIDQGIVIILSPNEVVKNQDYFL